MLQTASEHVPSIPLAAALEIAARRTVAQCAAQARLRLIVELDRAQAAITQARQLARTIA